MSSKKSTSRQKSRLQWGSKYVFKRSDKLSQFSLILTTPAPCALASFETKKITLSAFGGVQFMKRLLLESSRKELPLSLPDAESLTRRLLWEQNGPTLPRKKKQIAKNLDFLSTQKSQAILSLKNSEELRKKKQTPTNLQQPNPKPQDLPKNLQTKVLSNPNICFPTTPFVPNFRRRSAVFLRRSAKGSSAPAWKKVVLASSTWGIGTSRLDYLNKLGKTVGKSRERCRFSFIKE